MGMTTKLCHRSLIFQTMSQLSAEIFEKFCWATKLAILGNTAGKCSKNAEFCQVSVGELMIKLIT